MAAVRVLGSSSPAETGISTTKGDRESVTVEVEGLYTTLEIADPHLYVPSGYEFDSATVASTGDGMGRMSVKCIKYNAGDSAGWTPTRTTLRIDMAETNLDLISHEHFQGDDKETSRDIITKWLATDDADRGKRKDPESQSQTKYYWYRDLKTEEELEEEEELGTATILRKIEDATAIDFCNAYSKGITTFIRFDPVIEKISYWKNPPGISRNGKSFTGGTKSDFSQDIGKFSTPPLTLQGYANTNWFKSRDNWTENADRTWQRTEQWVYTPDGPSSNTGWIYAVATPNT